MEPRIRWVPTDRSKTQQGTGKLLLLLIRLNDYNRSRPKTMDVVFRGQLGQYGNRSRAKKKRGQIFGNPPRFLLSVTTSHLHPSRSRPSDRALWPRVVPFPLTTLDHTLRPRVTLLLLRDPPPSPPRPIDGVGSCPVTLFSSFSPLRSHFFIRVNLLRH